MSANRVDNNSQLKSKLESQLSRLLDQLQDLENSKDDLDEEEYVEITGPASGFRKQQG